MSQVRTDMWMPFDRPIGPRGRVGNVTGRLKPGVSIRAADAELAAIAKRLEAEFPESNAGRSVYVQPLSEVVIAPAVRRVLFMLFGAVGLLMALACANVMNLALARMSLRGREVAVRLALGASRPRLVRQFLTESLTLSVAGGVLGLAIAWRGTAELLRLAASYVPRAHEVGLDWRVFLFLLALCTITGAAIGVVPALFARRWPAQAVLQSANGRSTTSLGQLRLHNGLVVAEVALAFVLATGAAVLIRELIRLRSTDLGMVISNVVTFHLGQRLAPEAGADVFYAIERRVSGIPGVRAAGLAQLLPLQNWGWTSNSSDFFVKGRAPQSPVFPIHMRYVTPGYFDALHITLERGRTFTARDTSDAPPVIMINGTLARRYFGEQDPTGEQMNRGTIVGVVKDFRQVNADQPPFPELYFPIAQNWSQVNELGMTLVVSTVNRPEALVAPIRSAVRDVSPGHAIFNVKTMEQVVAESLSAFTLYLLLMGAFAVLAVVLALSGTYGVIAYLANARTKEFAIRVALGAGRGHVTRLVLLQGVVLTGVGVALGLLAAFALSPLLRGLPVEVRAPGLITTAPVALLIAIVATVACLVPAVRASRVNPMSALRDE
jgi:predicted permease